MASTYTDGVLYLNAGDNISEDLTYLGDLTGRTKLWVTLKKSLSDADGAALIQIEETAGLIYINGVAGTAINGSITVTGVAAGNLTWAIEASESVKLVGTSGKCYLDVKWADAAGDKWTLHRKKVTVTADSTRAVA
jgi:hypothetical protein